MSSTPPPGRLRPTSAAALAVAAVIGLLVGGAVPLLIGLTGSVVPSIAWTTPLTLVFLAVVVLVLAYTTTRALHPPPGRSGRAIDPHRALLLYVLGRACALGGAFVVGAYLAFALTYLGDDAVLPRERLLRGLFAAGAAGLLTAAGVLLERACRVPPDDEDDS